MHSTIDSVAALRGVSKRYGKLTALDHVDLEVHRGELLSVLGPNGAGKSTSIGLLLGLIQADAGRVELFGRDPQNIDARRHIGVMLQSANLPQTLRVGELLSLTASYYPYPRTLTESAELASIADLLKRPYKKLSGGQQRRVQFALACVAAHDCCSWMSRPWAWISRRGKNSGPPCARWLPMVPR